MIDPLGFWGDRPGQRSSVPFPPAHRTWLDGDRSRKPYQGPESPEDMDRCLTCKLPQRLCKGAGKGCGRRKGKKG